MQCKTRILLILFFATFLLPSMCKAAQAPTPCAPGALDTTSVTLRICNNNSVWIPTVLTGSGSPVGVITCGTTNAGQAYTDSTTGLIWTCVGTAWQLPAKITLTSTYTVSSSSPTNITGLSFPAAANTNYGVICYLVYQVTSTSTIPQVRFTGPGSPTSVLYSSAWQIAASTSPTYSGAAATAFSTTQGASPTAANTNMELSLKFGLLNGANAGTVQLQGAASVTGTFTVQPGSWCAIQ